MSFFKVVHGYIWLCFTQRKSRRWSIFGELTLPFPGSGAGCGGGNASFCWDEGLGLHQRHLHGFHYQTWWHCQTHLHGFEGPHSPKCSDPSPTLPSGSAGTLLQIFKVPEAYGFSI